MTNQSVIVSCHLSCSTDLTLECFVPPDIFILDVPTIENVGADLSSDISTNLTKLSPKMESTNGDGKVQNNFFESYNLTSTGSPQKLDDPVSKTMVLLVGKQPHE